MIADNGNRLLALNQRMRQECYKLKELKIALTSNATIHSSALARAFSRLSSMLKV
jgi:hypothetical protein